MPDRLSKSKALAQLSALKIAARDAQDASEEASKKKGTPAEEKEVRMLQARPEASAISGASRSPSPHPPPGVRARGQHMQRMRELQALQAAAEEAKEKRDSAAESFAKLKASLQDDAFALTPATNAFFAAADAGIAALCLPAPPWAAVPAAAVFATLERPPFAAAETLLAGFKRRHAIERGSNGVVLIHRISLAGPATAEAVDAEVVRLMATAADTDPDNATGGDAAALDAVELAWCGADGANTAAALRHLQKLCQDQTERHEESGAETVIAARRIRALGICDPSPRCAREQRRKEASIVGEPNV